MAGMAANGNAANHPLLPLRVDDVVLVREGRRLLDSVSLTVCGGGVTAIMGPNGAGKSLLIRLLHGLEAPTGGEISWAGSAMSAEIRKKQALVFQRPVLLRRSAGANVEFVLNLRTATSPRRDGDVSELLRRVGLEGRETVPAKLLSGGEQQRVALARALACRPDILFLDEATANLDPASTQIIEDIVRSETARGTKVILVTHDIAQSRRLADEVVFLHRGRVAEHSAAGEFFDQPSSPPAQDYLDGRIVL